MIVQYEVRDAEGKLVGYTQLSHEVCGTELSVLRKAYFTSPFEADHRMVLETECYVLAAFSDKGGRWLAFQLRPGQDPKHLPNFWSVS